MNGQITLFDLMDEDKFLKFNKPVRLIELFAGIGCQAMSLRDIGAKFERWKVVEVDPYCIKSYNAIHGTNFEPIDINDFHGWDLEITDTDNYTYCLFYSFPCTDISNAGKMLGFAPDSGTRSSLLWQVKRLLDETEKLPQLLILENVPQIHNTQNERHFKDWLSYLESKGYTNHWQDMNAKDYGLAQSRDRTFVVSALSDKLFLFPEPIPLTTTVLDYLEDEVDEKYYLKSPKAKKLIDELIQDGKILQTDNRFKERESAKYNVLMNYERVDAVNPPIANTLCARDYKGFGTGFNTMNGVVECQKLEK